MVTEYAPACSLRAVPSGAHGATTPKALTELPLYPSTRKGAHFVGAVLTPALPEKLKTGHFYLTVACAHFVENAPTFALMVPTKLLAQK